MGWKSFLKQQLGEGRAAPKALHIGGGSTELELTKHFRLVRKLGKGTFATVYEAERLTDGQRYALKLTDLHSLSREDKIAVVEEIRLLASLDHPCLISYFEAFCDHDQLCVVTELVMGGTLSSFLSKLRHDEDFLWERQVWSFFLQAALGVQHLHHNHVLHRDLKPQNIMLTKKDGSGLLKIVDLGVSAELGRVFTRVQIGTPHYMAPEMWERKAYSYSADIWALGCILHELCTLRPTFLSEGDRTEEDIRRRVLAGMYAPIPTRYSMELSRLVGLMLQKDPKQRPTIDEILAMPWVQSKFIHLPPELHGAAAGAGARDDRALLGALLQLPDDSLAFNCMVPRARYSTGSGVAELLCSRPQRRSFSLSDLQAAAGGAGSPQRPLSPAPGSPRRAASRQAEGGGGGRSGLPRIGSEGMLRRRSIMVGEVTLKLHDQEEGADAADASVPSSSSSSSGHLQRRSLQGPIPGGQHAAPPAQLPPQQIGREAGRHEPSMRRGMQHAPRVGSAGSGAAVVEPGLQRPSMMQRRSVTVAEVLHYDESRLKKQLEGKHDEDDVAELANKLPPLAREPFEFCAQGVAAGRPGGDGRGAAAGSAAAPARPTAGGSPRRVTPARLTTADHAAASEPIVGQGGPPPAAVSHGAPPVAPPAHKEEGKKQKKKGRFWRLMYGDDEESGMHQPTDVF